MLEGVCVSGGEPTLYPDIIPFLKKIKELGYAVKLDTNGYRPSVIREAIDSGAVDYFAMDIKNCPEKYAYTIGLPENYDLTPIMESKDILMKGKVDFEFRTTVTRQYHMAEDIVKIGEWIRGEEKYFLQQFKDSGDIIGEGLSEYNKDEMKALLDEVRHFVPNAQLRGV